MDLSSITHPHIIPKMHRSCASCVEIGGASIRTTAVASTDNYGSVHTLVKIFLSNTKNMKKIIDLSTERAQKAGNQTKTVLLQLCDGDHCLIFKLPSDEDKIPVPVSLFNFLNLPDFTFVGIGINKTLENLESEFGLTCNNAVEIGPSSWDLLNKTEESCRIVRRFISTTEPTSTVSDDWNDFSNGHNQVELATANAYLAFIIGNMLMATY
ncbi:unnamed protein product [Microthlaspi erraticum]|uniref:3'-5' exonuclease domain-containing protein n=1 Tax=Microthlaspi erraticum TaxID=1685480 RepID=A0A6D2IM07_9BRAS|nr:unnamed protein product [Microthlaspi erraticum]